MRDLPRRVERLRQQITLRAPMPADPANPLASCRWTLSGPDTRHLSPDLAARAQEQYQAMMDQAIIDGAVWEAEHYPNDDLGMR